MAEHTRQPKAAVGITAARLPPSGHDQPWTSQELLQVNGNTVRFRTMEAVEARWHEHTSSEELFFVLSGSLEVDVRAPDASVQTYRIGPGELLKVHAGHEHRARASERTTLLVIDAL